MLHTDNIPKKSGKTVGCVCNSPVNRPQTMSKRRQVHWPFAIWAVIAKYHNSEGCGKKGKTVEPLLVRV